MMNRILLGPRYIADTLVELQTLVHEHTRPKVTSKTWFLQTNELEFNPRIKVAKLDRTNKPSEYYYQLILPSNSQSSSPSIALA